MISFKPAELPKPWFDEGWTLSAAKNWAEEGVYALRLEDTWISPDAMIQPFTVIIPAGLSLRIFGTGVVQARFPGIVFTIGTLALLFLVAEQIYNTRVAWGTLFVALLLTPNPDFQPLTFGRQALGEMPMLFLLLTGYWFWLRSLQKTRKYIPFAVLFWGLGVVTKRQVLPFWSLSWMIPVIVALLLHQWRVAKTTLVTGLLASVAVVGFTYLDSSLYRDWPLYGPSIVKDLYSIFFGVWDKEVRLLVLRTVVWYGGFSLAGLLYAIPSVFRDLRVASEVSSENWGELSMVSLVLSWMTWFAFASLGWLRHFAPLSVLATIFVAKLIHDCSNGYSLKFVAESLTTRLSGKATVQSLTAIILVGYGLLTGCISWMAQLRMASNEPYLVAEYIHGNTPENALIETYDSELLFLVNRPAHYPPPEVQIAVILRTFLKQDVLLTNGSSSVLPFYILFPDPNRRALSISFSNYGPLDANPDYIIVGPFGRAAGLYDLLISSQQLSLVKEYPNYSIYEPAQPE